jgi:hypothetical protein
MMHDSIASVSIRPEVTILSVLRHLNYRPWYAVGEFVDNSLQSYLDHRRELERVEGTGFQLRVSIELDPRDGGQLCIRDNAAGIHEADYPRAFRPAEIPPDRSGMAEFGMGMKSAACWFAKRWAVRTSALGEPVARIVGFDIDRIVHERLDELAVHTEPAAPTDHFTEIVLTDLHRIPQTKTVGKIKQHLRSMYRVFIRKGLLHLEFDGEPLTFQEVKVLRAPYYRNAGGELVEWRKEIDFDFGADQRAYGFAALRETASTSEAGFALFRRDRLIVGSADDGYRPEIVFGKSNSYRYQRLFGELHLEGFEVTHTKDGFQWNEHEDIFLEFLKERLDQHPLPLLDQAEGHRVKPKPVEIKHAAEMATERTATTIEREVPPVLAHQLGAEPESAEPPAQLSAVDEMAATREITVQVRGTTWTISIELSTDPGISDWLSISEHKPDQDDRLGVRRLGVRLALAHPFMERYGGVDPERIEPLLRVAAALALAETSARASGVKYAGTIRRNMNEYLRDALSKP